MEPKGSRLSLLENVAPLGAPDTAGPLAESDLSRTFSGDPCAAGSQSNGPEEDALDGEPTVLCVVARSTPPKSPSRGTHRTTLKSPPRRGAHSGRDKATLVQAGPAPGRQLRGSEGRGRQQ